MDQIAQQLKAEIESLQEYIQRTEDRLQVTGWVSDLLDPFERLEEDFTPAELQKVVTGLFHAKFRFDVNGHLSDRINDILQRHHNIVADIQRQGRENPESLPAKDPEAYADTDSMQEDEESSNGIGTEDESIFKPFDFDDESADSSREFHVFQAPDMPPVADSESREDTGDLFLDDEPVDKTADSSDSPGLFAPPDLDDAEGFSRADISAEERENDSPGFPSPDDSKPFPESESGTSPEDLSDLFDVPENANRKTDSTEAETAPPSPADPSIRNDTSRETRQAAGDLFNSSQQKEKGDSSSTSGLPRPLSPSQNKREDANRQRYVPPEKDRSDVDIFSAKISIDDLLLRLGISIPPRDKTQLQTLLHHKVADRIIPALKANAKYEERFILLPRISRFIFEGELVPCTVKNLAKTYITLFGNIKDLMRYKGQSFFHTEVPQMGWALVAHEASRETVDKNFMEQTQYIRYLAASIGIPSHLVRRRTLVESVYDIIIGRMVLGAALQQRTLDWTSSGPSKSDFVCVYYAENGIRMRDFPRTTHNRALGTVPTW